MDKDDDLATAKRMFKVEDGGVYQGEDLIGEFLDGRFMPNLDLMNKAERVQRLAQLFATDYMRRNPAVR